MDPFIIVIVVCRIWSRIIYWLTAKVCWKLVILVSHGFLVLRRECIHTKLLQGQTLLIAYIYFSTYDLYVKRICC